MDKYRIVVETFMNETDYTINLFLAKIPSENIISIQCCMSSNEHETLEKTMVVYKKKTS